MSTSDSEQVPSQDQPQDPQVSTLDAEVLLERITSLASCLKGFESFQESDQGQHFDALRQQSLALIEDKLLPELNANLDLPLFVAFLGGTNTGKSTLFNALVGQVVSESKITASATKHPLVYIHHSWKEVVLGGQLFKNPCLLESSGELLVRRNDQPIFISFHQRDELKEIALIDCPDFDSIDRDNAQRAYQVVHQSDLCIFVTTPQKYKDHLLVSALKEILSQNKHVFVLFNLTDDEMLYQTMLEDLKSQLDHHTLHFGSYLETQKTAHPERAIQKQVQDTFSDFLNATSRQEIKHDMIQAHLQHLVARSQKIVGEYRDQTELKEELLFQVSQHLESVMRGYEQDFNLNFPEIGAALTEQLSQIELQRILKPRVSQEEEEAQWTLFLSHGFGLAGNRLRKAFLKSFKLPESPQNWKEFWQKRNEQDLSILKQSAQILRASIEQSLRMSSHSSVVSQLILHRFFNADGLKAFDQNLENRFWNTIQNEVSLGKEILKQARSLNRSEGGFWLGSAAWIANAVKLTVGLGCAYITGGFGFFDLFFLPLGFIGGAYGIAWLLHKRLKHKETLFKAQRVRICRTLFEDIQIAPLIDCVEQMANRDELTRLSSLSDQLEEAIP